MPSAPPQSSETLPHLSALLGALPMAVAFFDGALRFVGVNEAFAGVTGLTPEAHVGLGLADVLPTVADEIAANLRAVIATGEPVTDHKIADDRLARDGERRDWVASYHPVHDENRTIVGVNAVLTEVAVPVAVQAEERLRRTNTDLEVALLRANELAVAAEQADRAKSEFLAMMSHEIRTPLNGVIGMTSLLLDSQMSTEQQDCAETIRVSGEALLQIINDILDFSKIDAGRLELETAPCHPRTVVEDVVGLMAGQAMAKGVELVTLVTIPDTRRFLGDAGRIRQILLNLVGNAVKVTEAGTITIHAYLDEERSDAESSVIRFDVTDTGVGIAPDTMPRLFQPFVQADGSTTRKYGGTGLGLAISKRLAALLGGQIGVESEVGAGSTFWFTVRVAHDHAEESEAEMSRTIEGRRVLLVNDNTTGRLLLRRQLESWGLAVATALTEDVGLARLRSAVERDERFDALIVDLEMPQHELREVVRAIRDDTGVANTPLVLLCALGHPEPDLAADVRVRCISKPVRPSQLYDALVALLLGRHRPTRPPQPERRAAANSVPTYAPRILVAEDNPVNQKVAARMLEKLGYRIDTVANGLEAISALQSIPYAAILMDCQMPEMDGYEASTLIRQRESNGRHTPIIAMTASAMRGDREKCLAAGMDDYLTKPVRPPELAAVLARWVSPESGTPPTAAAAG